MFSVLFLCFFFDNLSEVQHVELQKSCWQMFFSGQLLQMTLSRFERGKCSYSAPWVLPPFSSSSGSIDQAHESVCHSGCKRWPHASLFSGDDHLLSSAKSGGFVHICIREEFRIRIGRLISSNLFSSRDPLNQHLWRREALYPGTVLHLKETKEKKTFFVN